ncbi:MAG: hypothetical protein M5U19_07850 [Microthrixaceae bacterium]|nr:hypothetical protein [Microthrixaceae bacterium]
MAEVVGLVCGSDSHRHLNPFENLGAPDIREVDQGCQHLGATNVHTH